MSEEKKYVTFRDLRAVSPKTESPPPATSIASTPSTPSGTSLPSISRTPSSTSISVKNNKQQKPEPPPPVAPERDFQRIPNSVIRQAIPEGLFRGKSKQVWDYLWSVSRGAVVPIRTVRKSRREIKVGSGLGSMVTVDAALEHLERVGLIAIRPSIGSLIGNEYQVFTPEEASTSISSTPSTSRTTSLTQNLVHLDVLDSSISSTTQTVENTDTYIPPKTFFNTKEEKTDDDEAFAGLLASLRKVTREITGKESSPAEGERWKEVADLLATELKIAAGRTTVSSVPAFLAEHLRRRLWKKDKKQLEKEATEGSVVPAPKGDVNQCPDCRGTGMYYPEGFEKGVAKCRHEKLGGAA